jgi:hypothetical protein
MCKHVSNLANIGNLFNLNPGRILLVSLLSYQTPAADEWSLPLLRKLLAKRSEFFTCEEDTSTIQRISLCLIGLYPSLYMGESGTPTILQVLWRRLYI